MKLIFWSLFMSSLAMAQNEGVTQALKTDLQKNTFKATLSNGYHFNDKAPNMLKVDDQRIKPTEFKKQSVTFKLPNSYSAAEAALYICDDANTFCEPRHINLKGEQHEETGAKSKTGKLKKNHHGFYEASLEDVKDLAVKEKKLLLVDFSARWCPGCIRLEQEVFNAGEFKAASKNFVKVKLDVDRFENMAAKKSYGVWAIPSLIVLNNDLKEISRVVDYQPTSTIAKFLELAAKTPLTFAELKSKIDSGDTQAALMLGQREYNAGLYDEAVTYLSKVSPPPIELADAKVQAAQKNLEKNPNDEKAKTRLQKTVTEELVNEGVSSRSIVWRDYYAASLPSGEERKKVARVGMAVADRILSSDVDIQSAVKGDLVGEFAGIERLLVAFHKSDIASTGELADAEITKVNQEVAEIGKQLKIPISKKGPSLRYLLALTGAKDFVSAEAQAKNLLKNDPQNPELQRRLLRILNENKKYSEAIKVGKEAIAASYDRNEIWVVQQLAKAYVGAGHKMEAKALINSYLSRDDFDWNLLKSELRDLREQQQQLL